MPSIVILGMHRSGTSLISGLLHKSGISMGEKFIPADEENPSGYWEDEKFLGINKGILENAGGNWMKPPKPIEIVESFKKFEKSFVRTVNEREISVEFNLWGFKDPRTSLTVEAFHHLLYDPKYIVMKRNDQDVVRSLAKRDLRVPLAEWRSLCEIYSNRINRFKTKFKPNMIIVSYESIVDPFSCGITLSNIAKFLGIRRELLLNNKKFVKFIT